MARKEEREEHIFKCLSCNKQFSKKVTKSDIPLIACPASCTNSKVEEITDKWIKQREKRRKAKEKRLSEKYGADKPETLLKTEFPRP